MSLIHAKGLEKHYGQQVVLERMNLTVEAGEFITLVGASGCGKTTFLKLLLGTEGVSRGELLLDGKPIPGEPGPDRGIVFQKYSVFPHLTVLGNVIMAEELARAPLTGKLFGAKRREARVAAEARLAEVGLSHALDKYPHELSGGMRQRIIIAIALLLDPDIIVADEPTTALDVTIQAEIMELLLLLCEKHNVGLILITHDLGVVSQVTQRTLVMYAGRVIEQGPTREIINDAQHPYTQGLINALPQMATPGSRLNQIRGSMPTLTKIPPGCAFNPRCDFAANICLEKVPAFAHSGNCKVACHMVDAMVAGERWTPIITDADGNGATPTDSHRTEVNA